MPSGWCWRAAWRRSISRPPRRSTRRWRRGSPRIARGAGRNGARSRCRSIWWRRCARECAAGRAVLVDCLTLWLTNLMVRERPVEAEIEQPARGPAGPAGCARAGLERGRPGRRAGRRHGARLRRSRRRAASADRRAGRCRGADDRRPAAAPQIAWSAMNLQGKIPTTVFTGFLGAGKTTLIRHLLRAARRPAARADHQRVRRHRHRRRAAARLRRRDLRRGRHGRARQRLHLLHRGRRLRADHAAADRARASRPSTS